MVASGIDDVPQRSQHGRRRACGAIKDGVVILARQQARTLTLWRHSVCCFRTTPPQSVTSKHGWGERGGGRSWACLADATAARRDNPVDGMGFAYSYGGVGYR